MNLPAAGWLFPVGEMGGLPRGERGGGTDEVSLALFGLADLLFETDVHVLRSERVTSAIPTRFWKAFAREVKDKDEPRTGGLETR